MKTNPQKTADAFSGECNTGWGGAPEPQRDPSRDEAAVSVEDDFGFPALEYALTLRSRG